MAKTTKKAKTPRVKVGGKAGRGGKDIITGNWSTEDGLELTFNITSNNTSNKNYFAIADWGSFNGRNPERYAGYADSNSNSMFDAGSDRYSGVALVTSWDGIPRYSGTFKATAGILELYSGGSTGSLSIPESWFA